MKKTLILFALLATTSAFAEVRFRGLAAKNVYDSLIGPNVLEDGAAGSLCRTGESIACCGPNTPEEQQNLEAYECRIRFTKNGKILPPR